MNCPNCGAANDADARFCAECGTPLENQDLEATMVGQNFRDLEGDQVTSPDPNETAAEDAKTVTVDQAQLAAAVAGESDTPVTPEPEPTPTPPPAVSSPPPSPTPAGADFGGSGGATTVGTGDDGQNRRMWVIVGVVVLLVLCCCCCSLAVGGAIGSDPEMIEDLINEISMLPVYLSFV